jgi:hypothetical protein
MSVLRSSGFSFSHMNYDSLFSFFSSFMFACLIALLILVGSASTKLLHVTRFVSLANVAPASSSKDKKYLHAISIETLTHIQRGELLKEPAGAVNSPYDDSSLEKIGSKDEGGGSADNNSGLSEAAARRLMAEDSSSTNNFRYR